VSVPASALHLDRERRARVWQRLIEEIEAYAHDVEHLRVEPLDVKLDPERLVAGFDFDQAADPLDVLGRVAEGLRKHQVHTPHPGYFGLFNPAPTTMGIAADALVAAFNPQLATFSHSPFAVAAERYVVRALAGRFGFDPQAADGTFCTGGNEANQTALLVALARKFPEVATRGLRALAGQPTVYVTSETHDSIVKTARAAGLGSEAVRVVPTDASLRMVPAALTRAVIDDRAAGHAPFLVVATAGTTAAGVIDPLPALAEVAALERLWLHVDAAWGGGAALVPELRSTLAGVERADSVTFDAHKWLSVPMGAGLFLTPHAGVLDEAFAVAASYMPAPSSLPDPYARSIQWSRRFIGLKVLMSLAVAGWEGYEAALRHQTQMANLLRQRLTEARFRVVNDTPLPLVCFVDDARPDGAAATYLSKVRNVVASSGDAWISVARLGDQRVPALRACITNVRTTERNLDQLLARLEHARASVGRVR
jgi:glutamate/tyrosine decarboxylase-like PLP-dependent enzyme